MRRLMLLLLLVTTPLCAQQSSEESSESMICLSASEWEDMEARVLEEVQRTALEAAEEAVKPHLAYEAELKEKIESKEKEVIVWRNVAMAGWIAAIIAALIAVFR